MYYYREEENRHGKIAGGIAAAVYVALLLLLFLLVKWNINRPDNSGEGIMINFGNVGEAAPGGDLDMNDEFAPAPQVQTASSSGGGELLTQDVEDAPAVQKTTPKPQAKPAEQTKPTTKPTEQPPAEKPREADRRALFPGRTAGSTATSDGTGTGAGNQGNMAGSPDGTYDGTGTGTSGNSASLNGRSLLGNLPRPEYNAREQGRVIVEIVVDQQGKVTSAAYRSRGSTTQNSELVAAALRAARQATFNVDMNAALSQTGTITYNFRMQ